MPGIAEKNLRAWRFISASSIAAALTLTIRSWAFGIVGIDAVHCEVFPAEHPAPVWPFLLTAVSLMLALIAAKRVDEFSKKAAPCWLLWPLLAMPYGFFTLAAMLTVLAWSFSRCLDLKFPQRALPRSTACCFVALLAAMTAGWSFFLQDSAFRRMFLAYSDWGEYAECYLKLAGGAIPPRAWLIQAGHFNLLPNLVMGTLFRFWRAPEAVFFVSAVVSGVIPVLIYKLAREYRLPRSSALLLSFAATFSPVLMNQSLSFFYGFHPVLFQGPVVIGFFIFERRKNRIGMAAMIALSLLAQETAAVLWFGYALYLLSRKRFRFGAILAASSVAYFVFVSKVVMPFAAGGSDNPQLFHYAQLGNSLGEVLASPFAKPRAFWGTVFQRQNLFFATALLLPCGVLALRRPRRMLIVLPLFLGVIMQNSNDVKNPAMQYGFEITVVLLCATVAAAGEMLNKRTDAKRSVMRAGVRTVAAMSLLCALGWGLMPFGKYSAKKLVLKRPDAMKDINMLREYSKSGGRVLTTKRLRLYHMFDRKVATLDSKWEVGDTIVLDLKDPLEPVDHIRSRLLDDPRAVPVFHQPTSSFVVWKIGGAPRPPWDFLYPRRFTEEEFRNVGPELSQNDPAFEARVPCDPNGQILPLVLVRLKNKVDYDVEMKLKISRGEKEEYHTVCFGNIYPAWYATPGDTFMVPIGGKPKALQLSIERRK